MPDFSPAVELAWQTAADEALQLGSPSLEPHHLLIGVCSVEKILALPARAPAALAQAKREKVQRECEAWGDCVAEAGTDSPSLRRAIRRFATSAHPQSLDRGAKIRRSPASQQIFARATSLATSDSFPMPNLLHLAAALLEKPEEKLDAAFEHLNKRKVDLQVSVLRRLAQMAPAKALDMEDASMFRIAAKLDASFAPYSVGTNSALDQERAALLYELPLRFGKGGPLSEMLQETVSRIGKVVAGASDAALLVKDRASGELLLLAHVPPGAPAISMTLAKRVLESCEACVWVRGQGDSTASLDGRGVQSGVYAPLLWNAEALGVFCVSNHASREFRENSSIALPKSGGHILRFSTISPFCYRPLISEKIA